MIDTHTHTQTDMNQPKMVRLMLFNDLDNQEILVACCVATVKDDETCERLRQNLQSFLNIPLILPCLSHMTRNRIHLRNKINNLSGRSLNSLVCPVITSILENKDAATPELYRLIPFENMLRKSMWHEKS